MGHTHAMECRSALKGNEVAMYTTMRGALKPVHWETASRRKVCSLCGSAGELSNTEMCTETGGRVGDSTDGAMEGMETDANAHRVPLLSDEKTLHSGLWRWFHKPVSVLTTTELHTLDRSVCGRVDYMSTKLLFF